MKLLSYKFIRIFCFGNGEYMTSYELTVQKSMLFGFIKKQCKITYDVPMFASIKAYEEHWDRLIATGERLK